MKVSVITATFNSSKTITDCVKSVYEQKYDEIEHIIIDGASNDNTLKIIKSIPNRVSKIVSEPDGGIYDAMNKGIRIASGDIIAILNSDDFFIDNSCVSSIIAKFKETKADAVIANTYHVKRNNVSKIVQSIRTPIYGKYISLNGRITNLTYQNAMIYYGWIPPHTSLYILKRAYDKYGNFNTSYKVSADFDLMFRFFILHNISLAFLDKYVVKMREGGASTNSIKQRIINIVDSIRIIRGYGYKVGLIYSIRRISSKTKQRKLLYLKSKTKLSD